MAGWLHKVFATQVLPFFFHVLYFRGGGWGGGGGGGGLATQSTSPGSAHEDRQTIGYEQDFIKDKIKSKNTGKASA